jgi:hypothetical protein
MGEMFGSRWFFFGFGRVSGHRAQWMKCLVDGKMAGKWKKKRIGFFLINLIFCLFKFIK